SEHQRGDPLASEVAAGHQGEVLRKGHAQASCDEQGKHSEVREALQKAEDHCPSGLGRTYTPPHRGARGFWRARSISRSEYGGFSAPRTELRTGGQLSAAALALGCNPGQPLPPDPPQHS